MGEHTLPELRRRFEALDEDGNNQIDLDEFVRFSLRDSLHRSQSRVMDVFRMWDDDGSGQITKAEFSRAIGALGFPCSAEDINACFDELDADGSGLLTYKELNKQLRQTKPGADGDAKHGLRRKGGRVQVLPPSISIEPKEGETVQQQLRAVLDKTHVRLVDLFRAWDEDGNGVVSKEEFRKAFATLGYFAPREEIDGLFTHTFDVDGSGYIDFQEMIKVVGLGDEVHSSAEVEEQVNALR